MADGELAFGSSQGRWVIAATVLGSGIASLDATVVGIALPSIGRTFHSGVGTLQWVVTGYALTLAAFLLLGGSLGDRLGRKRVFSVGVVWFALSSVLCGLAPSAGFLIAARVLQGIGGALLTPASLAILQASFRADDRSRAIGAWSGLGGVATAAGPLVGGYLIAAGSWRWVFFINIPISLGVLLVAARHVPETSDPTSAGTVDGSGAALAVLFLAGLTYGLIEGPGHGWTSAGVLGGLILASVAGPLFLLVEHRRANPMLPLGVFRTRQFSGANAVTFIVYGALGGALFLLPIELQLVSRYSPLSSGLALLPVTVIMLTLSARSGQLAARIGPRLQMTVGPFIVGAGLILLWRVTGDSNYLTGVFPAVLVFGLGLAVTVAPLTSTAMGAAPAEHAGVASAVNNVVARAAGLLAVAVLPLLAGITGAAALHPSHFAHGFRTAVVIAGLTCAAGGALAAATIRNPTGSGHLRHGHLRQYHCAVDGAPLQPDQPGAQAASAA
ncbi:MAG TPA: DHA2 family efflux MFS transporter permease subunit [Acidimicrobiales bacterium]|jgi:EmrB/QacA subfamily drug resistance transporter|nr:DHA2 family efflux MFS transporter permease subunit [Acidimicrobiales bacterium]